MKGLPKRYGNRQKKRMGIMIKELAPKISPFRPMCGNDTILAYGCHGDLLFYKGDLFRTFFQEVIGGASLFQDLDHHIGI